MKHKYLFGAQYKTDGVRFNLWCSQKQKVQLVIDPLHEPRYFDPISLDAQNIFSFFVPNLPPGVQYGYQLEDKKLIPDPASRFQPQGVHGPSEVIDPFSFVWTDQKWKGLPLDRAVFYELHVGTFSPKGTFDDVITRLAYLKDLGVNAVELMPLADFAGERNWGYDGVSLFAPSHRYGRPNDLRRLVNEAHRLEIAVYLDVVYNHLGPDGSYITTFAPEFLSTLHQSPWSHGINLDGKNSSLVRAFLIENALSWIHEYHLDGLRLDATHALVDLGPQHFLAELSQSVADGGFPRQVHLIAEDARNLAHLVSPVSSSGWGMDAVWADDFHHQMRRYLAGDIGGYYQDYAGTIEDIVKTARQGWFYTGQANASGHFRGSDPQGLTPEHFVYCLQNHDQIGNRAFGERLNHQIEPASYRAALTLFLTLPYLPLLFMGQEWAASSPFLFFTNHHAKLGEQVSQGRREEFKGFPEFNDPALREKIPDPQDPLTFENSKLRWKERDEPSHQTVLELTRRLLSIRAEHPAFKSTAPHSWSIQPLGLRGLLVQRSHGPHHLAAVILLKEPTTLEVDGKLFPELPALLLTTEDPNFALDPQPIQKDLNDGLMTFTFKRPGAVLMEFTTAGHEAEK